jgi:uncharacterized protein YegJ (DUF2314 family)
MGYRREVIVIVIVMLFVAGCGKQRPADKVSYVADDDPRMNAAIAKARSTVNTFIAALKAPKPGQSVFSVKVPFTDGPNTEHIWLTPVSYDGKRFRGTVDNEPEKVKNVRTGQNLTVAPSEISDWMYVENRKLIGGYTLRVLRDALTADERVEFDRSVPFTID